MAFCGNCGTELKEGQAFCPNCGAPTGLAPQKPVTGSNPPQFGEYKEKAGEVFNKIDDHFDDAANKVNDFINNQIISPSDTNVDPSDGVVIWLNVIAFLFPIVGVIIYFVNRGTKPVMSQSILKWALIGFVVSVILRVLGIL